MLLLLQLLFLLLLMLHPQHSRYHHRLPNHQPTHPPPLRPPTHTTTHHPPTSECLTRSSGGLKWPEMDQDGLYGSSLFLCITTCLLLPAVVGVVAAVAGCVAACCVWLADCCRPHVRASAILLELRRSCLFIFEHCEAVAGILLFHRHCEAVDVDTLQLIPARPCLCSLATTGPA